MTLGDHTVLQGWGQAPQQLLKFVATFLAQTVPLMPQRRQRRAGAISDAAALFERKFEPLLQLRQRHHRFNQRGAHRAQLGIVDLTAQPTGRCQRFRHGQQLFSGGHASLAAAQHNGLEILHTAEAEPPLSEVIEHRHFNRLGQALFRLLQAGGQRLNPGRITAHAGAGKAAEMVTDPMPLQQFKGFLLSPVRPLTQVSCSWRGCHRGVHKAFRASCLPGLSDKKTPCRRGGHGRHQRAHPAL